MLKKVLLKLRWLAVFMVATGLALGSDLPANGNEPPAQVVPVALRQAEVAADPVLIAALARIDRWSDLPAFKKVLDGVKNPVDAVRDADAKTTLHRAAQLGYSESMTLLLRRGADVNALDARGRTPLFDAVLSRSRWALEVLVLWGAEIDHGALDGSTPLIEALKMNDPVLAEVLLWLGARTRVPGAPAEWQPQALAEASGNRELSALVRDYDCEARVTFLRQPRVVPSFIKQQLHDAARRADFRQLEDLVRLGLNLNVPDEKGKTPLHVAIAGGHGEMVFYLLLLGADANLADRAGVTPFMESLAWLGDGAGNATRLFLIAKHANPRATRRDGHSEFTWAADRDNEHAVQWLLWMGADPRHATAQGTPFQVAWRGGHKQVLDMLRQNGIDEPLQLPTDPAELLQVGAKLGEADLIATALDRGALLDQPDRDGNSPMMTALLHRNVGTARLLMEQGADIHFQNPVNHQTPICSTLPWNGAEINQLRRELLEAGVDVTIQTKKNRTTPLMMALIHGPWLLKELIEHGADPQARDKDGLTVLGHARKAGQTASAEYLRGLGATE